MNAVGNHVVIELTRVAGEKESGIILLDAFSVSTTGVVVSAGARSFLKVGDTAYLQSDSGGVVYGDSQRSILVHENKILAYGRPTAE